jgi:hypothetical protein
MHRPKQAPSGTQLRGYNLWATEIDGAWYIVDANGERHAGPFRDEHSALWHGSMLVDSSGT